MLVLDLMPHSLLSCTAAAAGGFFVSRRSQVHPHDKRDDCMVLEARSSLVEANDKWCGGFNFHPTTAQTTNDLGPESTDYDSTTRGSRAVVVYE